MRTVCGLAALMLAPFVLAQEPAAPPATPEKSAPAAPAGTDLFPLQAGAKWTYKVGEITIVVRVAGTEGDGTKLETVVGDKVVATEVMKVTPESVLRLKINDAAITPPVKILSLKDGKPVMGEKWTVDSKVRDAAIKGEFMVKKDTEKVSVGLGEFDAVLVEGSEFDIAGTKTAVKYWFVPGKGVVKLSYNIQGNESALDLKEYTDK